MLGHNITNVDDSAQKQTQTDEQVKGEIETQTEATEIKDDTKN